MSKKPEPQPAKPAIDQTGFQITRAFLKLPATVTAQTLGIHVDGMIGMAVNKFDFDPIIDKIIELLNGLDLNDDHKSDVAEIAPLVVKALPFLIQVAPLVSFDGLKQDILALPVKFPHWFKDAGKATQTLTMLVSIAEEAAAKVAITK